MLVSALFATVALSASLAKAFPSSGPALNVGLEARTGSCSNDQWFYSKKSCCVKRGGDSPGNTPTGKSCPQGYYWHKSYAFCVPKNPSDDKGSSPKCTTNGHSWNDKKNCCNAPEYSCDDGEFWWKDRSCCVKTGGPKSPPSPPTGSKCPPKNWSWDYGKGSCVPHQPNPPSEADCESGWGWKKDIKCCRPKPTPPSPPPAHPSTRPYNNYNNNHDDDHDKDNKPGRGYKRDSVTNAAKRHKSLASRMEKPVVVNFCPAGYEQCPVSGVLGEFECLDTLYELTSCGGCASTGAGVDCTQIPHVDSASCFGGFCNVFSCQHGYKPSDDERSCVPI